MRLGITIVPLICHQLTISFTPTRLEDITINISEAKGLYMGLLIVGITLCRIIRDAWFAMDTDDPEQALAGFMWGVNRVCFMSDQGIAQIKKVDGYDGRSCLMM